MTSTMFSAREVPWMKLGRLETGAKTASEAARLGGLDFTVEQRPLQWVDTNGTTHTIDDRRALVRTDTNQQLSIMSADYPVLQFSEAFDFMDGVNPEFVAAGALKGGKQGFMVVKGPEMNVLSGDDPHELFTILRTSHDGSRAVEVSVMPLRNMCMNMLALSSMTVGARQRWAIRHTSSMPHKLADAHESLQRLDAYAQHFERTAATLAALHVTDSGAEKILTTALPDRPRRDEQITTIIDKWHNAETVGFDWTGWGLLNAVSEYFDWGRVNGTPESRLIGAMQGSTSNVLNKVALLLAA